MEIAVLIVIQSGWPQLLEFFPLYILLFGTLRCLLWDFSLGIADNVSCTKAPTSFKFVSRMSTDLRIR